jgi:hypothetical protein
MNYTIVVLGGVLFLSLVWYYFPVYGGVHWFKGPIANVVLGSTDKHEAEEVEAEEEKEKGGRA